MKIEPRYEGAFIVRAAESYSRRVAPKTDAVAVEPTEQDRALARAVLRAKTEEEV